MGWTRGVYNSVETFCAAVYPSTPLPDPTLTSALPLFAGSHLEGRIMHDHLHSDRSMR